MKGLLTTILRSATSRYYLTKKIVDRKQIFVIYLKLMGWRRIGKKGQALRTAYAVPMKEASSGLPTGSPERSKGQAMTEYLVITIIAALMAITMWRGGLFNNGMRSYYNQIATEISDGIRF